MTDGQARLSVLIIDDDKSLGKTLSGILKKAGYDVSWVSTGGQAITALEQRVGQNCMNVALIDIALPDMSGVEVLKNAKKIDPDIGAIMITGNAEVQMAIDSLREGAFAYIQKPYNVDELKSMLQKVFEKQKLMRENRALMKRLQDWNTELERTIQEKIAELKSKNLTLLEMVKPLQSLNEILSRFVANASHELQTPLTSILGYSSMLMENDTKIDKEHASKFLEIIRQEAWRLSRATLELLDLNRIQKGEVQITLRKINIRTIAENIKKNLEVINPGVDIRCSFDKGACEVVSDEDKVQQIFINLVENAMKYSRKGSQVMIEGKDGGKTVIIHVIDQGPGIPEDKREKIFEPFYRINDDVGKKLSGTGLGLSIVKAIVEALGGTIWVEGEVGKGSNFTFVLPKET